MDSTMKRVVTALALLGIAACAHSAHAIEGRDLANITVTEVKPNAAAGACDPNYKSPLCGSNDLVATVPGNCLSATIDFGNMESCCETQTILTDPCHVDDGLAKCRTATIQNPVCGAQNLACQAIALKMSLEIYRKPGTCCKTCSCYGDPHCESFSKVIDTWMLCDARARGTGANANTCSMSQKVCSTQLDHNGNKCVWRSPLNGGSTWLFGIWGSQCMFNAGKQNLPSMTMYETDNFKIDLKLGERGIIVQAIVTDDGTQYFMNSDDCWNDWLNKKRNPWRSSATATAPLTDPNWLPNKWKGILLPGDDRLWMIYGLKSGIRVNIRCTRNRVKIEGKTRLGLARLNVEAVIEPVEPTDRQLAAGFCVTDKIDKQKSTTDVTDSLKAAGVCLEDQGPQLVARMLCTKGVTAQTIDLCKEQWCKTVRADWEQCFLDIGRYTWPRTWCAAKVLPNNNPFECVSGQCKKCMSDIADFGWEAAINIWDNYKTGVAGESQCYTVGQLPFQLTRCQKGIEIQYEQAPGNWITHTAIPDSITLCDPKLTFDSITPRNAVLFSHPVRVKQCSLDTECLQDQCTPELGFVAKFDFQSEKSESSDLVSLVQNNDLVCDPVKYPGNPLGCITIPPPQACPCV